MTSNLVLLDYNRTTKKGVYYGYRRLEKALQNQGLAPESIILADTIHSIHID